MANGVYSALDGHRTMKPAPSKSRRRCSCGCSGRATHMMLADGCCMGMGCELLVRRWIRDPVDAWLTRRRTTTEAGRAALKQTEAAMGRVRTGDTVYHEPSGETWLVAWADYETGYMAPCGWPTCEARIQDCRLIEQGTDEKAAKLIDELAKSGRSDAHKARSLRALEATHE